jgi:phasin family protein
MAQSNNPFNFDPSKMFTIDPQQMMAQWQTALESINLPGVDMSKILDAQRKNVEAITQANRIALEGVQSLMQRQAEIMQQSVEEATKMMQNFDPASDPTERVAQQTALAQEAFQQALDRMRELAEMANKSQAEAFEAIQARFTESLEEIRNGMQNLGK